MNENVVRALSPQRIAEIVPLATRSLRDKRLKVRRLGMLFFMSLTFRMDGTALIEPALGGIESIASEPGSQLRPLALYVLGGTLPQPSNETISFLASRLDDKDLSAEETATITGCLLGELSHPEVQKKAIEFARNASDPLKANVARQIGILRISTEEAIAFLSKSLFAQSPVVRESALRATARFPPAVRPRFSTQLDRIIGNSEEPQEFRDLAASALHSE